MSTCNRRLPGAPTGGPLRGRVSGLDDVHIAIIVRVTRLEDWWSGGEHVIVELDGVERPVFVRRLGKGAPMTLLHGFPSCSYDWSGVVPVLAHKFAMLLPDLLGFGASEKPREHVYSISEQADLVEALWAYDGIASTTLVAHDYSVSIVQELLARKAEDRLGVELVAVHLLNGGLYPDLHRPEPIQTALLDPEQGPRISAELTEQRMAAALRPTFAATFDPTLHSADIWRAASRNGVILDRLIRYMPDRRENESRWVTALETSDTPLSFIWGMLDPISGAHVAERLRERLPDAPFTALTDTGHWPPLEAPQRVGAAVLGA